jgi:hypothetical protein
MATTVPKRAPITHLAELVIAESILSKKLEQALQEAGYDVKDLCLGAAKSRAVYESTLRASHEPNECCW